MAFKPIKVVLFCARASRRSAWPISAPPIDALRQALISGRGSAEGFAHAMAEIARAFGAHQAMAFVPSYVTAHGFAVDYLGWRSEDLHRNAQTFAMQSGLMDPWRVAAEERSGFRTGMVSHSETLVPNAQFDANPWSALFAEHDVRHLLGYVCPSRAIGAPVVAFSMFRSARQGAFGAAEIAAIQALAADIETSADMHLSLSPGQLRFDEAIEAIEDPVFLIRRGGVMSWANAGGVRMLQEANLLRLEANLLRAAPAHLAEPLRCLLVRALGGESGAIGLIKTAGRHLYLRAAPLRMQDEIIVLARVRDAKAKPAPRLADLMAIFGFTHAEADVALGLLTLGGVRAIAEVRQTDVETVRSQIRQIYDKLGVHKASDAVAMLARAAE